MRRRNYIPRNGRRGRREYELALAWAKAVKERDDHTCRRCGSTHNIHAHHMIGRGLCRKEQKWNVDIGVTLCANCHAACHDHTAADWAKYFIPKGDSRRDP